MQFLLSKYKKAAHSDEFPSIVSCLQQRNLHNLIKTEQAVAFTIRISIHEAMVRPSNQGAGFTIWGFQAKINLPVTDPATRGICGSWPLIQLLHVLYKNSQLVSLLEPPGIFNKYMYSLFSTILFLLEHYYTSQPGKIRRAKQMDKIKTEEHREQSGQSRIGEPVNFVFDVPIHPR